MSVGCGSTDVLAQAIRKQIMFAAAVRAPAPLIFFAAFVLPMLELCDGIVVGHPLALL